MNPMAKKAVAVKAKKTAPKKPAVAVKNIAPVKKSAPTPAPAAKSRPSDAKAKNSKPLSKQPAYPSPTAQRTLKTVVKSRFMDAADAPVARDKKVVSLTKADLEFYRKLLLEKRRELLGDVGSMESEALRSNESNLSTMPIHMADVGSDNYEQEFTLGLIESERKILREIQEALARVDDGSYGICLGTSKPIPRVRLDAVPWAKYTIEYSRLLEAGKVGIHDDEDEQEDSSSSDEDEE